MTKLCVIIMIVCVFNLLAEIIVICIKNGGLYVSLFGALNVINLFMYACFYEDIKKGH